MREHAPKAISKFNKLGFTLLELLVALVILMVGLLGMLQAINISIQSNMQNEMRTQGVMIGEDLMARIKNLPFDNITGTAEKSLTVPVSMRSSLVNYTVRKKVDYVDDAVSPQTKRINIGVQWIHKGNRYEHVVSSVVSKSVTQ
jgi:type IV pilus assembly protein PilV